MTPPKLERFPFSTRRGNEIILESLLEKIFLFFCTQFFRTFLNFFPPPCAGFHPTTNKQSREVSFFFKLWFSKSFKDYCFSFLIVHATEASFFFSVFQSCIWCFPITRTNVDLKVFFVRFHQRLRYFNLISGFVTSISDFLECLEDFFVQVFEIYFENR